MGKEWRGAQEFLIEHSSDANLGTCRKESEDHLFLSGFPFLFINCLRLPYKEMGLSTKTISLSVWGGLLNFIIYRFVSPGYGYILRETEFSIALVFFLGHFWTPEIEKGWELLDSI